MSAPDPNLRVSNEEREAVIAQLHQATEAGRLELQEFSDRATEVYKAKTYADLEGLLVDLPNTTGVMKVPGADLDPIAPKTPSEVTYAPKASSIHRQGNWLVPRVIKVNAKASSVKLDLRHAIIGTKVVDINVDMKASSLELIMPQGAYAVDDDMHDVVASTLKNRVPYSGSHGLRVNVSGALKASSVKIRREYRFLWWRW